MINKIKRLIIVGSCILLWWVSMAPCTVNARWFWEMFWVGRTNVPWTERNTEDSLLHTIRVAINRVLWMLSFIALVLCLYAGFKMMTSWWDSKQYDAWFSILKNAALWLAIIALSRLIVSLVFWLIEWSTEASLNGW